MVIWVLLNIFEGIAWSFQGEIQVPQSSIAIHESVEISVVIEDAILMEPPKLKVGLGLEISFVTQSHISEIGIRDGKSQRIDVYTYTYKLRGLEEGIWHVTAPIIQVGKQQISMESKNIQVHADATIETSEIVLVAQLLNETPYEGEVVSYDIKYSKRIAVAHDEILYPNIQGFQEIEIPMSTAKRYRSDLDGYIYHHHEERMFFQANSAGAYSISPTRVKIQLQAYRKGMSPLLQFLGMNSTTEEHFTTHAFRGLIRPLPQQPNNFSGLVGDFSLVHVADRVLTKVGESIEITTKLEGNGVIPKDFDFPQISSKQYRIYETSPVHVREVKKGLYRESKTLQRTLIPLEGGKLSIPSISIHFFNPQTRSYEQLYAPEIQLNITGQAENIELNTFGHQDGSTFLPRRSTGSFLDDIVHFVPLYFWTIPICVALFFRNTKKVLRDDPLPKTFVIAGSEKERIEKWFEWIEHFVKMQYSISMVTYENIREFDEELAEYYQKMLHVKFSTGKLEDIETKLVAFKHKIEMTNSRHIGRVI